MVDTVKEVSDIPEKHIEPPPDVVEGNRELFIKGLGKVEEEVKILLDVDRLLHTKVTDIVGEIAAASNEQAQGISQITQGLGQVDQVTQQNTAHAVETASAAEELSSQAQLLQGLVSNFKIITIQRKLDKI